MMEGESPPVRASNDGYGSSPPRGPDDDLRPFESRSSARKWKIPALITAAIVFVAIIITVVVVSTSADEKAAATDGRWTSLRLPTFAKPIHYNLRINPDIKPQGSTFEGHMDMFINVTRETDYLAFHQNNLTLEISRLVTADGDELKPTSTRINTTSSMQFVEFGRRLSTGLYTLHIAFDGMLNTDLAGFYQSSYVVPQTQEKRYLAVTHFEPVGARRAFPCFDEPAFKATFNITLITDQSAGAQWPVVLSNMDERAKTPATDGSNKTEVHFHKSLPMSTYLVAFVFCDFTSIEKNAPTTNTLTRVWAPKHHVDAGRLDFALDTSGLVLDHYTQIFDVPYPMPKCDMIAIPDFEAGAMENWGLITYRDTALLQDPTQSSTSDSQRVAVVVAHELAHQWFGNLVTMAWWDGLWLNEGFASWMEYRGVDAAYPDWSFMDQFLQVEQNAFDVDALLSSHPIRAVGVESPEDIDALFDSISYDKGASIINMVSNLVNLTTFDSGLSVYLNAHKYGNAETSDLWAAQSQVSGQDISEFATPWVDQQGFPVLRFTGTNDTSGSVKQSQFWLTTPSASEWDKDQTWPISMTMWTSSNQDVYRYKTWPERSIAIGPKSYAGSAWYAVNSDRTGFFRTQYPQKNWDNLRAAVANQLNTATQTFKANDRAGFISDAFAFFRSDTKFTDFAPSTPFAWVAETLIKEESYVVWESALGKLSEITTLISTDYIFDKWQRFQRDLLKTQVAALTWTVGAADEHNKKMLRSALLVADVTAGSSDSTEQGQQLVADWMSNSTVANTISADVRNAAYRAAISAATDGSVFDFFVQQYNQTSFQAEKLKLLYGMCQSTKPYQLRFILDSLVSDEPEMLSIRSNEVSKIVAYISNNPVGNSVAWDFLQVNWDNLANGGMGFGVARLISSTTKSFSTQAQFDEAEAFFNSKDLGSGASSAKSALETIRANMAWKADKFPQVESFLQSRYQ